MPAFGRRFKHGCGLLSRDARAAFASRAALGRACATPLLAHVREARDPSYDDEAVQRSRHALRPHGQIVQSNVTDLRPSFCARRFDQSASDEDQTLPSRRR